MINLLPDQRKTEIKAARVNVLLVRYTSLLVLGLAFIFGVLYVSYLVLASTNQSALAIIESNDVKADVYKPTKDQVDALSASLTQTKVILDQEVLYSRVLVKLAQEMPAGTVLETLTLNESSFNGSPLTARVFAKTTEQAVALQEKFRNSSLFSNVSFQSIEQNNGVEGYPVSISISFTLNRMAVQ